MRKCKNCAMTKQYAIPAALFLAAVLLMSFGNVAFATTTGGKSVLVPVGPDGMMEKAKGKTQKSGPQPLWYSEAGSTNWNDCTGNPRSASENIYVPTPTTSQVQFKWSWPSYTWTGVYPFCIQSNFGVLQHTLTDVTQGWTVYSTPWDTAYNQPYYQAYNLQDSHGNPLYIYLYDHLNPSTAACYGGNGYSCAWTGTVTFAQIIAT